MKDLYNLQKQAREMQNQMKSIQVTGTSKDGKISIVLNGSYELIRVAVAPDAALQPSEIEAGVTQAFNDASAQVKTLLMDKFKGMV